MKLPAPDIRKLVRQALKEDGAFHDITTQAIVPKKLRARAVLLAKQDFVLCGRPVVEAVFHCLDMKVKLHWKYADGASVKKGAEFAVLDGSARALLSAERVALNFLQRLSGIATCTRRFVTALRGTRAKVLDTRKTTPGLRLLERYAVAVGGGTNHRFNLASAALAKDNHLAIAGSVSEAFRKLGPLRGKKEIILEVKTLAELDEALKAGARYILLDNMSLAQLRQAVRRSRGRAKLEASGGVSLQNIRAIAKTGVDFVSVGALTHSAPAVDISLEMTGINSPKA